MNKQVVGLLNNINSSNYGTNYSHLEVEHWASVLDAKVIKDGKYSSGEVYLYLGNNYTPGNIDNPMPLNMFGGFTEQYYNNLLKFLNTDAVFKSINFKIPYTFLDGIVKRAELKTASTFKDIDVEVCKRIRDKALTIDCVTPEQLSVHTNSIMIGDSHCYSISPRGVPTKKLMAQTLNGAIKRDLFQQWASSTPAQEMYFMLGSVDIQFHIFRQPDPIVALNILINQYKQKILELLDIGKTIQVCSPVPIVGEHRKLAKTTVYKDMPFYGSRDERINATLIFIDEMRSFASKTNDVSFEGFPIEWYYKSEDFYHSMLERNVGHHINLNNSRIMNYGQHDYDELF